MNPSRIFILRPVATTLLMVAILLSGIVAYRVLPLSDIAEGHRILEAREAFGKIVLEVN